MNSDSEDHDPFNEPTQRSKRSVALMKEDFFWDCTEEESPFGSDEGWEAYYSFRDWRSENPKTSVVYFLDEIMYGRSAEYNLELTTDDAITVAIKFPKKAFLGKEYTPEDLDMTVLATVLGQLIDEGKIEKTLKPFALVAIARLSHKSSNPTRHRLKVLKACSRVVCEA